MNTRDIIDAALKEEKAEKKNKKLGGQPKGDSQCSIEQLTHYAWSQVALTDRSNRNLQESAKAWQ